MRSPVAVAIANDRVYLADFDNDRVQAFTRAGEAVLEWGATGQGPGQFRSPAGVAIGADGSVFVTDTYNHRIQHFTADGDFLAEWSAGGDAAAPFGIAVDRLGRVFVTDLEAAQVSVWSSEGVSLASWGTRGSGRGEMDDPWGIVVDGQGDVLVADHANHRIQRFSAAGEWLGEWGVPGSGDSQLMGPMGLANGRDGSIVVTDLSADRVRRFTRAGDLMATLRGADASERFVALGLALDAGGDVFIADPGHHQVARIPGAGVLAPTPIPTAFAMMPIAQPLGHGPVRLDFAIPGSGTLGAQIFSLDGRRVYTVPATGVAAGEHRITWDTMTDDGHRAPVGVYFVRVHFELGGRRITRSGRVIVLR
jgi:DNA-binding beta-propeller fold protein YncE